MKCNDFWKKFEESGLNPKLEKHLDECNNCKNEMEIEFLLNKKVKKLTKFKAPEELWDNINRSFLEENKLSISEKIKIFFEKQLLSVKILSSKPALAGYAVLLLLIAFSIAYLKPLSTEEKIRLQAETVAELEKKEQEYTAAIEKFSKFADNFEKSIDPELYQLYQEKLAVLDEFILQCKEAVEQNEYNINAREYLALAYKEKTETLKNMYENYIFEN